MAQKYVYVLQYLEDNGVRMDVFGREVRARVTAEAVARTRGESLDTPARWSGPANTVRLYTQAGAPTEFTVTRKTVR